MPDGEPVEIPFLFIGIEDAPILFSNLQIVQHEDQEFVITFGQYTPPLALGDPERVEEEMRKYPHVAVKTVARIAMTPKRLERFIDALQRNYDKWKAKAQE
jgi:hypothetical protein